MKVVCEGILPFELLFGIPIVILFWTLAAWGVWAAISSIRNS